MATFEEYLFTKNTKWIFWGLGALLLLALVFRAGVVVGYHQALRFHGLEHRSPADGNAFFGLLPKGGIPGHGAVGTITTVTLPTLMLQTRDGMTEPVVVGTSTIIRNAADQTLLPADLKVGDTVIIIGDPNDTDDMKEGQIEARLIRVVPALPSPASSSMQIIQYRVQQ